MSDMINLQNTQSNHFEVQGIEFGRGSTVHWSKEPAANLFVFIHGFAGTAEGSWFDTSSILREDEDFNRTDLLFLGYNSSNSRAIILSRMLEKFLRTFFKKSFIVFNKQTHHSFRSDAFKYRNIVIYCHSLGGALMRQIALDFARNPEVEFDSLKIVLFAPAHKGANSLSLADNFFGNGIGIGFISFIRNFLFYRKPIFQDLKTGCGFITKIEEETLAIDNSENSQSYLQAAKVYFGQFERIVNVDDFANDPPFEVQEQADHINISKSGSSTSLVVLECKGNVI